tara:strand:+ start:2397 stop:2864 length:468 start_codon:yes stop_codon:yes gene_type:complete
MKEIEDNKVYYSWKDYNKDMKAIEWLKFDHVVAIYRGSLIMGTHVSNVFDVPLSIVGFQTRDGNDKSPYWMHNATLPLDESKEQRILVVDDIYDTGYTMDSVIEFVKKNRTRPSAMPEVYGYCLFGKYNSKGIVYSREHDGSWIVYPWETLDEPI